MVKGGAIVCRMGARIRRGEELAITRTLARIGIPILRTLSGLALMEGGSFAWINSRTAVIGCGVRVNREGAAQIGEVLQRQGVELIVIDLVGYDIHIDGSFLMVDRDLALIDPTGLPYSFLERLKALGVRTIEIEPADNKWIVNSLAVAPSKLIMPEGGSNRTLDALAQHGRDLDDAPLWQDAAERRRHPLLHHAADPRSGLINLRRRPRPVPAGPDGRGRAPGRGGRGRSASAS